MPGGKEPYAKGRAHEKRCQKTLEDKGYFVVRVAGSKGPVDLVAILASFGSTFLIQCRLSSKMSPAERVELVELAEQHVCFPILYSGDNTYLVKLEGYESIEL